MSPMGEPRTIAVNRRARHEYTIEETIEAGIVLTGTEIKSIRAGKVSLAEAYARVDGARRGWSGRTSPPGQAATASTTSRSASASCCSIATRSTS